MKRRAQGRPSKCNTAVTRRISTFVRNGVDQKTACSLVKIPYSTFNEWKTRGQNGEEPFASFFSVISRARDRHKARLLQIVLNAAEGVLPRHADWKAAGWLLEKGWPLEFGDRRPLPNPREERETPIGISMQCTLPSGNIASVDEMMEVARQWHEAAQPRQQREPIENKPTENEPMEMWYNPVTRRVEPIDNFEQEALS